MHRRHHDHARGLHGETRRDDTAPRTDAAAAVLALQESAGNQAVGALLARVPAGAPEKTEEPGGAATVTLAGIGAIQVESVRLPAPRGGGVGSGGRGSEKPPGGEVTITSRVGPHSSALMRASTEGKTMNARVDFNGRELHLELGNALVAGYQVSAAEDGGTESWTLNVESIEFVTPQPDRDGT